MKDKVKQRLDASLNKFIGYRKNKGVFHCIKFKFAIIINAIKLYKISHSNLISINLHKALFMSLNSAFFYWIYTPLVK
jgi:uncharacterized membrane protein